LILQSARYYELEKAINLGLVEWEKIQTTKTKIRKSLLVLIDLLIEELDAEKKEHQRFEFDSKGNKRNFEPKLNFESIYKKEPSLNISEYKTSDVSLILRFLTVFNKWYFSPLRIKKWGAKQNGFNGLDAISTVKIKKILIALLEQNKVKVTTSKKGNPIYKVIE
jgi:hypothetical protein